ncbi:MAG: tetratricopeptide repeat protein [Flavobacteriaceae bacterium]
MQEQDYLDMEKYLSNTLSGNELHVFEARLQDDDEFKEAFHQYAKTSQFLEGKFGNGKKDKDFKDNLERISASYFEKDEVAGHQGKQRLPWYYGVAAAAVVLIGFFLFRPSAHPTYAEYADHGVIGITVRESGNQLLVDAENAFNTQDYKAADSYFKQLIQDDPINVEFQLYRAISLVEQDKYGEAETLLNAIVEARSVYGNKALWYLALSQLKQGKYDTCAQTLRLLPEGAEDYGNAQELLGKLD